MSTTVCSKGLTAASSSAPGTRGGTSKGLKRGDTRFIEWPYLRGGGGAEREYAALLKFRERQYGGTVKLWSVRFSHVCAGKRTTRHYN